MSNISKKVDPGHIYYVGLAETPNKQKFYPLTKYGTDDLLTYFQGVDAQFSSITREYEDRMIRLR